MSATNGRRPGRPKAILAFDIGTSETKTGLVGLDGTLLGLARARYDLAVDPLHGTAEQDPEDWWNAMARSAAGIDPAARADVVAVAVDGHGPTLAAVDDDGRPTRPAITWLDSRAGAEVGDLSAATGLDGWLLGVLPAALWLERHDAAAARATRWYLNTWEAAALRLSGRAATSLVPGQPFAELAALAAVGLDTSRIAEPIAAGSVLGGLTSEAASVLRLPAGTPVVSGMNDAFATFHGAGMVDPGDAMDAGGAAGGFGVYWDVPVDAPGASCTPAPLAGRYIVGGAMAATGKALDWLRDDLLGGAFSTETLLAEASGVPAGADGLVFLPYLAGERSPLWDPRARGAFAGLTLKHGRAHLARAVLEAAALAIRHVAEPIVATGVQVDAMRLTGGPARSELWNRIKADVTGFPVEVPHVLETAVLGSAIAAAAAVGAHPDVPAAIRAMSRIDRRIEPSPEHRAAYDALFEAYVALHPAISPIVNDLEAATVATSAPAAVAG